MTRTDKPWNEPKHALPINTRLMTRDGRNIGNALVIGHTTRDRLFCHIVKTDYGNETTLTLIEIKDWFYLGTIADKTHKHYKE